jgi:hypothetical protein
MVDSLQKLLADKIFRLIAFIVALVGFLSSLSKLVQIYDTGASVSSVSSNFALVSLYVIAIVSGLALIGLILYSVWQIGASQTRRKLATSHGIGIGQDPITGGGARTGAEAIASEEPCPTEEQVFQGNMDRYGVGFYSLKIEVVVQPDGSAKVVRRVELHATDFLRDIDTFLLNSTPSAGTWNLKNLKIESLTGKFTITHEGKTEPEKDRISSLITFAPPMNTGDTAIYRMTEQFPETYYGLNRRGDEIDGFGWNINRPTRKFDLDVFFPAGWNLGNFETKALYATASGYPSDREIRKEMGRLKLTSSMSGDRHILNLAVEYPMPGLIYQITWVAS